jgi:PBSX family phage portal protein
MTIEAFTFGDPVPVTSVPDVFGTWAYLAADGYYEPPVPFAVLAKSYRATSHHGSAIQLKRNLLAQSFVPHPSLSRGDFAAWALDFLVFGNAYLQRTTTRGRKLHKLSRLLSRYTRRGADLSQYWWVPTYQGKQPLPDGDVYHAFEADIDQEVYGLPDYIGSLQAAWLGEAATLFRRKYYLNGSHAGYILYINDAVQNQEDIDAVRKALKDAKGPGNFRNLFLYSPGGKKDGIQVIPVSEVAAKDDFFQITTVARDSQLAGHRVPPQLLGIVPANGSVFGSVAEASRIFFDQEVRPLQSKLSQLNEWLGEEVVTFHDQLAPAPLDPAR